MKKLLILTAMVILGLGIQNITAQASYAVKSAKLTVAGTSSLHDWESNAGKVLITGQLAVNNNTIAKNGNFEVKVPVKSIKSAKGKIMDNKTYDALKAEEYPNIRFLLTDLSYKSTSDKSGQLTATGNLTIAGATRSETLTMTCTLAGNDLTIKGSKKLKMTDFKVDPPTALLGTLKTGDDITINFEVVMTNQTADTVN
ncbi:MAG TPA: YceI family protein [Flavilitoribacter sp.]|nr:YceI family protein [Lewinella sp.]HMQ60573.1 YceI family protein [Flavilitoribacter sp.]HMQ87889.1 YceI family protein [Flavilitoribacter sp.]